MLKRSLLVLGTLAVIGVLVVKSGDDAPSQAKGKRMTEVRTASVDTRTLPERLSLVANLEAWRAVTIAPEVSGRLAQLGATSGSQVSRGDMLATLDDQSELANRDEAQAYLIEAQRLLEERSRLADKGAISASELASQAAEVAMAQARLDGAKATLAKRHLLAPFNGVVGLVSHATGAQVNSGEPLMTLDQLDRLRLDLPVPQRYLALLKLGQVIQVQFDAYPGRDFSGTLVAVDSRVDSAKMTVAARFEFANPDGVLKPGMLARADLTIPASPSPVIPVQAMEYAGSDRFVYIIDDQDVAHRTLVETGARLGSEGVIAEGLSGGERIVVQGLVSVKDGQTVTDLADADDARVAKAGETL